MKEEERERFEAWQKSQGRPDWMRRRRADGIAVGEYADTRTEAEWEAWQARASLDA